MLASLFLVLAAAQADAPRAADPAPARPRTVCRNESVTGSRMSTRRVCRTVGGDSDADRQAEQEARDTQARVAEEAERARDNNGQNALGSMSPS